MESNEIIDFNHQNKTRIYSIHAIWISGLLSGPLAATYMISENFKALEDHKKSKITIFSSMIMILVFIYLFNFQPSIIDISIITLIILYAVSLQMVVELFQKKKIQLHLKEGGKAYGFVRLLMVNLISLATSLILLFVVSVVNATIEKFNAF